MSDFQEDPDLEEKLKVDPRELDEDELQEVQIYKSQKLKALRDSGESGDRPAWWESNHAPQSMDELAGAVTGEGAAPEASGEDETDEEPEQEETGEEAEEPSAEEEQEEAEEEPEPEPEPEEAEQEAEAAEETTDEKQPATRKSEGVPQVGWSSGVPQTEEIDFEHDVIQGIYERQDDIMEALQSLSAGMDQIEVGGEAIDSIQQTLNELNERVEALSEQGADEELQQKVNDIHELLASTQEAETKLAALPPLPEIEELVEAGIIDKEIEHDNSDNCFHTSVDNRKAALHYGPGSDRLTVYHYNLPTILSEPVRRVVEDILARALFEHAREEGKTVHPQAPQLRSGFLARHPEYYDLTPEEVRNRRVKM